MPSDPLPYAAPHDDQPRPRRTAAVWFSLIMVWGFGLIVWLVYIILIIGAVLWLLT